MPTRRDPDSWKRRAKADPWRRWLLKALPAAIGVLLKLEDAIALIERLFARRPAPIVIAPTTGRIVMSQVTIPVESLQRVVSSVTIPIESRAS
jgi:hypothetical protein